MAARDTKTRNAEQTRNAILQAALAEFSSEGVAGARTDRIARAAHVNKALLYYYFKDKGALYGAVLDHAIGNIYPKLAAILDSHRSPREKILAYVGAHFDALAGNPQLCRVIHSEMTRVDREGSQQMEQVARRYQRRLAERMQQVLRDGIEAGEFRAVDSLNFTISMAAANVFYFVAAPMLKAITGFDPFTSERIAARRAAVLDLISHALFVGKVIDQKGNGKGNGESMPHPKHLKKFPLSSTPTRRRRRQEKGTRLNSREAL